jgi:hypothetical protein
MYTLGVKMFNTTTFSIFIQTQIVVESFGLGAIFILRKGKEVGRWYS